MKQTFLAKAAELLRASMRRKRWYRVCTGLAAAVVFVTTYMLILPAITLTNDQGWTVPLGVDLSVEPDYTAVLTLADGSEVTIGVYDPDGHVPEGAELSAELYEEGGEQYLQAESDLWEYGDVTGYDGMMAMDIHFADAEGNEVEPTGAVYVDLRALLPENVDPDSVAVQHHVTKESEGLFGWVSGEITRLDVVADSSEETGEIEVTPPTEEVQPPVEDETQEPPVEGETQEPPTEEDVQEPPVEDGTQQPAEDAEDTESDVELPDGDTPTTDTPAGETPETKPEPSTPDVSSPDTGASSDSGTDTGASSDSDTDTGASSDSDTDTGASSDSSTDSSASSDGSTDSSASSDSSTDSSASSDGSTDSSASSDGSTDSSASSDSGTDSSASSDSSTDTGASSDSGTDMHATFAVDSFSTFTITWNVMEIQEPELVCGLEEHTHEESCYDADGNLICTLAEHTHTEDCYAVVEELPEEELPLGDIPEEVLAGEPAFVVYVVSDDCAPITVTVYDPDGVVPAGAELKADLLAEGSDEYAKAKENLDASGEAGEYTGMAALDIRFELDGSEVEPTGQVYVDIQAQALIPADADPDSVAVQHHVETEADKIFGLIPNVFASEQTTVETVADSSAGTGDVTVTPSAIQTLSLTEDSAAAQDLEAQFAVESFSTFTITWNANGKKPNTDAFQVTAYRYDDGKTSTPLGWQFTVDDLILGTGNELVFNEENPLLAIDGYRLVAADITYTYYQYKQEWWGGGSWETTNGSAQNIQSFTATYDWAGNWTLSYVDQNGRSQSIAWYQGHEAEVTFSLYYEEVDPEATGALYITDTIAEEGTLTAAINQEEWQEGDIPDLESGEYYYRWQRQAPGAQGFETVSGEIAQSIPVYYDGAQATYRVQLYKVGQAEPVATSYPYQVPYYDQLQNGSFESPKVSDNSSNLQFTNGLYPEMVWQTTGLGELNTTKNAAGQDIEIINADQGWSNYGENTAADGEQYAELNCEWPGALYQDVLTIPNDTLYWWASHQARYSGWDTYDTMYVVIMDATEAADHVTTQDDINAIIDAAGRGNLTALSENEVNPDIGKTVGVWLDGEYVTATVWRIRSNAEGWHDYADQYQVPEGQYLTRFFFGAGNESEVDSQDITVGNLLDNVGFNQFGKPDSKTGAVTIQKTVTGLAAGTEISANSFQFTVGDATISLPEEPVSVAGNGTVTFTKTITGLEPGPYTVEETNPTASWDGYVYQGTTVNGSSGLSTDEFLLAAGDTQTVRFVNSYQMSAGELEIQKEFVDSNGNSTNPPDSVASIQVTVQQYYYVTEGTSPVKQIVSSQTVTLAKGADSKFSGVMSGAYPYTEFLVTEEKLLDADGNVLTGISEMGEFTIDRRYTETDITANFQSATEGNQFEWPGAGYILAKETGGNNWNICMRYLPSEEERSEVLQVVLNAIDEAHLGGAGGSQIEDNVTWRSIEDMVTHGATVVFDQLGNVSLTFRNSSVWAQHYYGAFTYTNVDLGATLTNELTTGNLSITKTVARTDGQTAFGEDFQFQIQLLSNGTPTSAGPCSYTIYSKSGDGWTAVDTGTLTFNNVGISSVNDAPKTYIELDHNQKIVIEGLPANAVAQITETDTSRAGYSTKWTGDTSPESAEVPGATVTTKAIVAGETPIAVTCTNTTGAVLPSTGGMGTTPFVTLGSLCTLGAGLLLLAQRRRKGGSAAA